MSNDGSRRARRLSATRSGRRDVALAVLRLPGEPFAQGVNLDSLARFREERRLSRRDRSLDELDDTDLQSLPEGAERQPQGRCRLSLAGAGIHDEQSLLRRPARSCCSNASSRRTIFSLWAMFTSSGI